MVKRLLLVVVLVGTLAAPASSARHISSGSLSVRGVLANEVAAQNAGDWRAFYRQFDPISRRGCSYRVFHRSWSSDAKSSGLTGRRDGRIRYSNVHVWVDDVTGSYAFVSYDIRIGHRFVGHITAGDDSFIRRGNRWYDRFENGDYAHDCI